MLCHNKYKECGRENALTDAPGRSCKPEITDEEKAWIISIACQIEMQFDEKGNLLPVEDEKIHTISYDEKPGIQAIAAASPDRMPTDSNGYIQRAYEYKRLGTLSLLAGIDLLTGEAIPLVSESHKSSEAWVLVEYD